MGLTPVYNWPYPELNNPPDGATQMKNLALAIEPSLKKVESPPTVQVRQSVAQSINNGGSMLIFEVEDYDSHGMHSTSSNTSRLTATVAGWYLLWGNVSFAPGTTGRRGAIWYLASTTSLSVHIVTPMPTSYTQFNAPTMIHRLNVGEFVELQAYQDTGAAVLTYVSAPPNRPLAGAQWIAPY